MKKILLLIPVVFLCLSVCGMAQTTWQKIYQTQFSKHGKISSSCLTDSGNFYVAGSAFVPVGSNGFSGLLVMKLNQYGDKLWEKIFGGYPPGQGAVCITESPDHGCVISGSADTAFCLKFSAQGNLEWRRVYNNDGARFDHIIQTSDEGYLLCGVTDYLKGYILKIDSLGNQEWDTIYTSEYSKKVHYSLQTSDGYLLCGFNSPTPDQQYGFVTKLDLSGHFIWEKNYFLNNFSYGVKKILIRNNNYWLIGSYYINSVERNKLGILKINGQGEVLDSVFIQGTDPKYIETLTGFNFVSKNKLALSIAKVPYVLTTKDTKSSEIRLIDTTGLFVNNRTFDLYGTLELNFLNNYYDTGFITGGYVNYGNFQTTNNSRPYIARLDSNLNVSPVSNISNVNLLVNNFSLHQNYPNPFNPSTKISYSLKKSSAIELKLFDINGRLIKIIESGFKPAGSYEINFSAEDLSSGVYFFSLYSEGILMDTKKAVVVK